MKLWAKGTQMQKDNTKMLLKKGPKMPQNVAKKEPEKSNLVFPHQVQMEGAIL